MNQGQLTRAIAQRFFLTQTESREIIKFILAQITENLKKGQRISCHGFGTFTKEKRKAKKVRHPKTGKLITIPARNTVEFSPSRLLLKELEESKGKGRLKNLKPLKQL